ncbi:MAG: hypothetical protein AAF960_09925 [Bacteroidota bacterium]
MIRLLFLSFAFFWHFSAFGQLQVPNSAITYQTLHQQLVRLPTDLNLAQQVARFTLRQDFRTTLPLMAKDKAPIPAAYAYKDLAFFCKIEVQLEKAVKMPVKFRLGSVDYVDYLEGKKASY